MYIQSHEFINISQMHLIVSIYLDMKSSIITLIQRYSLDTDHLQIAFLLKQEPQ